MGILLDSFKTGACYIFWAKRANAHFGPTSSQDIHIPTFSSWTDSQVQLLSHRVAQSGMKILIWRLNGIPNYEL